MAWPFVLGRRNLPRLSPSNLLARRSIALTGGHLIAGRALACAAFALFASFATDRGRGRASSGTDHNGRHFTGGSFANPNGVGLRGLALIPHQLAGSRSLRERAANSGVSLFSAASVRVGGCACAAAGSPSPLSPRRPLPLTKAGTK